MRTFISSLAILIKSLLLMAAAQPRVISGKVTDNQGTPLQGVIISVKYTNRGTVTDLKGNYRISLLPQDHVLVYSLKGYGDVRLEFPEDRSGEITQMVAYFGFANITFRKTS